MSKLVGAGCILGIVGLLASAESFIVGTGLLLFVTWIANLVGSSVVALVVYIAMTFVANYLVPVVAFTYGKRLIQKLAYLLGAMAVTYALIIPSVIVVEAGCRMGHDYARWAVESSPVVQVIDYASGEEIISCRSVTSR
ncbi:MAG TPA: hypothetical protein VJ841_04195 [Candidatus Saccharimonadales bacterium]|nr:hypothetical protein [Candidatus Saccharimonadales bacterium]